MILPLMSRVSAVLAPLGLGGDIGESHRDLSCEENSNKLYYPVTSVIPDRSPPHLCPPLEDRDVSGATLHNSRPRVHSHTMGPAGL